MKITDKHIFFYGDWLSNFAETKFVWEAFGEKHEFLLIPENKLTPVNVDMWSKGEVE